ncbi:hypothetical protein JJE79_00435 [Mycoplasma sp. E35C]|nr:hypothetical protein JJE79_00435 [Mycoplasma sp. E35C]
MNKLISFISHKSLYCNIIASVFLLLFFAVFIYWKIEFPTFDKSFFEVSNISFFSKIYYFYLIYFLFIVFSLSFGLSVICYFNKIALKKQIKEITNISFAYVLVSFLPIIGIIIDLLLLKRSSLNYRDWVLSKNYETKWFLKTFTLVQIIFAIICFIFLNTITFLVHGLVAFDFLSLITIIPVGLQILAILILLILVVLLVIHFTEYAKLKILVDVDLKLKKKNLCKLFFSSWRITHPMYKLEVFNNIDIQEQQN